MRNRWTRTGLAAAVLLLMVIGSSGLGHAHDRCTVAALDGLYVFTATGFSIPTPTTSAPKAIVELIRFNGDSTLIVHRLREVRLGLDDGLGLGQAHAQPVQLLAPLLQPEPHVLPGFQVIQ